MSRTGYNLTTELDDLLEGQQCPLGYGNNFKFRLQYPQNVAVPTLDIPVTSANCLVAVDLMRSANSGATGFYYGMVHETLLYQYIGGVGSYLGSQTHYTFASGSSFSITNTLTSGRIIISFTQSANAVTTFMAGWGSYTVVPNSQKAITAVSQFGRGNVIKSYIDQTSVARPLFWFPYRQFFQQTNTPVNGTYIITPNITLDARNLENSTMILRVVTCLGMVSNHSSNSNRIDYVAVQGGSITVPPYSMLIRNLTNYYSNSTITLTLAAVAVTGSASTPPAVHFTAAITGLVAAAVVGCRVECVCATNSTADYIG
jgi:hypothetical protein